MVRLNNKFIQFKTEDGLTLPGIFFEANNSREIGIYIHGSGSSSIFKYDNYYIAQELLKKGISLLMFDNRGAHLINKIVVNKEGSVRKELFGSAYEIIKDCVFDINASLDFVKSLGYKDICLIGGSTGANKICIYNHYFPNNKIQKYVLISGGDDIGYFLNKLGKEKFYSLFREAEKKINNNKGDNIIEELIPSFFFTYKTFYHMLNPEGDNNVFQFSNRPTKNPPFQYFREIKKPTLVIYPQTDKFVDMKIEDAINLLKKFKPNFDYKIIKNSSHSFSSGMNEVSRFISDWLVN